MQTPTDSSCTSSNANGASGSLPAITVIQVEIMEMKLLPNLQISFWAKNGLVNIIAHIARRRGLDPFSIVNVYRRQQSPSSQLWKNAWPTQRPARAQTLMDPGLKLHLWIIHLSECVCSDSFSISAPTYQPSWRQNVTAPHVPRLPQTLMLSKNVLRVRKITWALNILNISFQIPLQPLVREHIRTRTGRCCRPCWPPSAPRPPAPASPPASPT